MENQIFREKSLERLSAPEELNDHLHVTNPAIWVVLAAVVLVLSGLLIWSNFTSIDCKQRSGDGCCGKRCAYGHF